jgi:hypothetical protein
LAAKSTLNCSICGHAVDPGVTFCKMCGVATDDPTGRSSAPYSKRRSLSHVIEWLLVGSIVLGSAFGASMLANVHQESHVSLRFKPDSRPPICFQLYAEQRQCFSSVPSVESERVEGEQSLPSVKTAFASYVFVAAVPAFFFVYLWLSNSYGGSLGTRMMELKVVRKRTGENLGLARGLVRTVAFALVPVYMLSCALRGKSRHSLPDRLAGSQTSRPTSSWPTRRST